MLSQRVLRQPHIVSLLERACIYLTSLLACGCATHVYPPVNPSDPVPVYLADYGRHSSILLPVSNGGYEEYAFGDWNWFALGHTDSGNAVVAMLGSPKSTLGRRHIDARPGTLTASQLDDAGVRLMKFAASRLRVDVLAENLDARFRRPATQPIHSDYSHLEHVPDTVHYWALHNCNHETAAWLRALGCTTKGPSILSNFVVENPVVPPS